MRIAFAVCMAVAAALAGCSDIEQSAKVKTSGTQIGDELVAGKGDAVIEIVNEESLPNAFGAADIFGRKRPTGTTSIIFVGGTSSYADFVRRDVTINSEKTTMNSSMMVINRSSQTFYSGSVGGTGFSGTANTYAAPIFLPPNTPADTISGVREMRIRVATTPGRNSLTVGGKTMIVLSTSANELRYQVK